MLEVLLYAFATAFSLGFWIFAGFVTHAAADGNERMARELTFCFFVIYGVIIALAWFAFPT